MSRRRFTGGAAPTGEHAVDAVVFDVGETLVDDTSAYAAWAEWIGVPAHTLSALIGAVTAAGDDLGRAFDLLRPNVDLDVELAAREAAGRGEQLLERDLYPDVRGTLATLRAAGLWVGIAGNQTSRFAGLLRGLRLPADVVLTSGEIGMAKPSRGFFDAVMTHVPAARDRTLYVGDNLLVDVAAAGAAGLRTALLRRGPLGHLWSGTPLAARIADWRIDSLEELPSLLR